MTRHPEEYDRKVGLMEKENNTFYMKNKRREMKIKGIITNQ